LGICFFARTIQATIAKLKFASKQTKPNQTKPNEMTPLETLKHHITGAIERGEAQAIVEIPCKPWHDFSELVSAIRKCETRKQFDRIESLCDKAYCGGAITAKQLAKLDGLQADCMIERGAI
jgi:hypothetical protein